MYRLLDEAIVPVADLVTGGVRDGDAVRLDQGKIVVAGGDEPVPLPVAEETLAARIVGRRIRAAEDAGEQGGRQVVVGRPAGDAARRVAGPAHEKRRVQLE